jgi:ABC-2 type transport system permease protein
MSDLYLFRKSIKDLLRVKRLAVALLLVAIPVVFAIIQRSVDADFNALDTLNSLTTKLVYGFLLTILSIVFGTDVIARELDDKTIVYLLTRAVPRWRIALTKFAAAVLMVTLVAWFGALLLVLVTVGPGQIAHSHLGRDLAILPVGALAYSAAALAIATLLKRPLIAGLVFAFGWETWVPNMTGAFHKFSIMTYLNVLAPHGEPEPTAASMMQSMTGAAPDVITMPTAWETLVVTFAVCMVVALVAFSTREYVPKEEAD